LNRLDIRSLWNLAPADDAVATAAVAAVLKNNGVDPRKILQSMPLNNIVVSPGELMRDEVDYGLLVPGHLVKSSVQMMCCA
jgi:phage tail sheath gpL-like